VKQRRFARARGAHDRHKISLGDIEVDVAQDVKKLTAPERIGSLDMTKANQ
jgi:hypothetical protein